MSNFVLEAKKRDLLKKEASKRYRKEGFIPANMYGQGQNVNFLIKKDAFEKISSKISKRSAGGTRIPFSFLVHCSGLNL